jgi:hypothetical protein
LIATATAEALRQELTILARLGSPVRREPIRTWRLSHVERLHLPDGRTAVFKCTGEPFCGEADALHWAAHHNVPVPALHAATIHSGVLGMILEDLGEQTRAATDATAAMAAARLHTTGPIPDRPPLGRAALQALPAAARAHLAQLHAEGRFPDTDDIRHTLTRLERLAGRRAIGAELPPFGFCHGEFHPTSLHIGWSGWRLLDFGMAHNGPGLLDLATWLTTRLPANLPRMRNLIKAYAGAGGAGTASTHRGGLPPENWALGWHRVHAATWQLEQAAQGVNDAGTDPACAPVVRRQLNGALKLLA